MTIQHNQNGNSAGLAEPVIYAVAAIIILSAVSAVLEKIGVTSVILIWGAIVIVSLVTVLSANAVWPSRLSPYAVARRLAPPSMIASGQLAALAPAAFFAALWAKGEVSSSATALALAGVAAGLWLSALLFGVSMNRSGAYGLPQLFEARFGSVFVRMVSLVFVALPTFLLVCGQVLAFGLLAEHRLGIPANAAMIASIAIMTLLVWLPGVRGALIAGAISIAGLLIGFSSMYWLLDFQFLQSAAPVFVEQKLLADAAVNALPFLSEAGIAVSSRTEQAAFVISMAAAISILPVMTQFHPLASVGSRTFNTAAATSVALAVMLSGALLIVPSGLPVSVGSLPLGSAGLVLIDLAASALLHAMVATGAVHIFAFAGVISLDGYHGIFGRPASENGRLIAARTTVLLTAIAVGWVVLTWGQAAMTPAVPVLFAAGAGMFPATVAAIWWRRCSAPAAIAGMFSGAATVICAWLARQGVIDPSALVSDPSPVLEFMLQLSLAGSALAGMVVAGVAILAISFLPHKSAETSRTFFEATGKDRYRRLLNETAM